MIMLKIDRIVGLCNHPELGEVMVDLSMVVGENGFIADPPNEPTVPDANKLEPVPEFIPELKN